MNGEDLKNSILQRAIEGKLVEQREEEGTAEELYQQIQAEKEKLIKEGKIKKQKKFPEVTDEEVPFNIPKSWKWVKLGDVGSWRAGATPARSNPDFYNGNIPWLKTGDLNDGYISNVSESISKAALEKTAVRLNPVGSVLMAMYGATIGKLGILDIEATTNQACCACIPYSTVHNKFIFYYLMVQRKYYIKMGAGGAQPNISKTKIVNSTFPLPPLEEQKRIVAKIEELMPYVDEYDKANIELGKLNEKFPEDMQKSILQYAVQGKLVEQREEEGTAEELYQQIQAEKERLVEEGKIKKQKKLPEIAEEEIPFDVPKSWKWVRISEISFFQEGPGILKKDFRSSGVPLIRISGMQEDILSLEGCNYLDKDMVERKWKHFKLDVGDIVISTSASMDKICSVDEKTEGAIPYTGQIRFKMFGGISREYFKNFIKSNAYIKQINAQKSGGTIKHYGPTHLRRMIMPLPPFEEQKRIIEKVEELMQYTNRI